MIPWLDKNTDFPDVENALTEADGAAGLLAAGLDLSAGRLLHAYKLGIFPWFSEGQPVLWWSTNPRMVLMTDKFIISDSLKKTLKKFNSNLHKNGGWQIKFDSAFVEVMRACATPRPGSSGTWISEKIINAYSDLHQLGYAHSSEVWLRDKLIAAAYGVCIGKMFFGESMFTTITDMSKVALAYLVDFLRYHDVKMIDCQQETSHLATLGAVPMPRTEFILHLTEAISQPIIKNWAPIIQNEMSIKINRKNKKNFKT